ncbi:hypothetical protein ACSX1A_16925 [Pontibacter sp. MBLB2868]|uniref:hypothetical protein n=1 Tax=Pontibacter sp. MBLB2868 TaxID=3451555 RepID=UPI003F74F956
MKKSMLLVLFLVLLQSAFAQDKIIKLNGEEILAHVVEIKVSEITYQHPDSLTGKLYLIPKADVFMIRFANGSKEIIAEAIGQQSVMMPNTPEQMYEIGRKDAELLYKGKGAMWGSAASSFIFPYGLAGSVAIGLVRPKAANHPVSDINYLSNPDYVRGYEDRAKKRKLGKAAAGAGIGIGAFTVVAAVATVMVLNSWQ